MRQIYVRDIKKSEIKHIYKGLNSPSAFILRRSQILLNSAEGKNTSQISQILYCSDQCVRDAINAFNKHGVKCLDEKTHARHDNQKIFGQKETRKLIAMAKDSPGKYGIKSNTWTLDKLAKACKKNKIVSRPVSPSTIANIFRENRINWKEIKRTTKV